MVLFLEGVWYETFYILLQWLISPVHTELLEVWCDIFAPCCLCGIILLSINPIHWLPLLGGGIYPFLNRCIDKHSNPLDSRQIPPSIGCTDTLTCHMLSQCIL